MLEVVNLRLSVMPIIIVGISILGCSDERTPVTYSDKPKDLSISTESSALPKEENAEVGDTEDKNRREEESRKKEEERQKVRDRKERAAQVERDKVEEAARAKRVKEEEDAQTKRVKDEQAAQVKRVKADRDAELARNKKRVKDRNKRFIIADGDLQDQIKDAEEYLGVLKNSLKVYKEVEQKKNDAILNKKQEIEHVSLEREAVRLEAAKAEQNLLAIFPRGGLPVSTFSSAILSELEVKAGALVASYNLTTMRENNNVIEDALLRGALVDLFNKIDVQRTIEKSEDILAKLVDTEEYFKLLVEIIKFMIKYRETKENIDKLRLEEVEIQTVFFEECPRLANETEEKIRRIEEELVQLKAEAFANAAIGSGPGV